MQDEAYEGLEKFNRNREQRLRERLNAADDPREKYRLLKCIYTNRKTQLEPVDSEDGGPGSGHFRHRGRKGQKGGSIPYASTLSSEISSSYSSSKTSEGTVDTAKTKKTFTSVSKKAAVGSKITVYKPSTHSEMTYTKVDDDKYVSEAGTLCDITSIMQGVDFTSEEHTPYVHYVDKGTQKELYYNVSSSLPAYTASSATVYEAGDVEKLSTAEVGTSVFNYGTGTSLCKLGGDLYLDALNGQIMSSADVKKSLTKETESASEESSAETSKSGTSGSTQETSGNLKESSAAATPTEGFMTSSDFESLYQSSALEAAKAVQSMSMTDAMRYFQYTGADANTLSELSNLYDAGNEGDFNSFVSQVMEAGMGTNFKNDAVNAQQKLDYLKNVSEDPAAFLEKYGTSEEEASAAKKLKKAESMYEKGFITADEAEGLKTDALNACYQDQITLDQDKVTSELSKCSDMQSMLSSLNDMCPDIGSAASHLYDSGADDETITAAIANYYGMTAAEFNSKFSGKTGGAGETAAQNSSQSAQEQAAQNSSQSAREQTAETGTLSSGKADWLMTDGGNFSCGGKTYNPSTADEISNSKYAITAEGEIYKNVNDGSGDFMSMETGELHSAQELADATSLGMSATITAQFEALKAQQESNPDAIRCTHVEESEYPDTVLDTTTTSSKYINQQKKILQAIKDSGLSYQEAVDAINGIDAYSDSYYEEIRDVQQKGEDSKHYSEAIEKMGEDIESYIEEAPKWTGSPLFRGICCSKGTFDYIVDCVKNGLEISQKGMSSWSSGENVAERFSLRKMHESDRHPVIFEMKKGTKQGTSICHMSFYGHSEDEVLVSNKQRVKATGKSYYKKVKKGGKSYKVLCIQVEEV